MLKRSASETAKHPIEAFDEHSDSTVARSSNPACSRGCPPSEFRIRFSSAFRQPDIAAAAESDHSVARRRGLTFDFLSRVPSNLTGQKWFWFVPDIPAS